MITQFKTIQGRSESLYKEKGSKFIGIACPVLDLSDVNMNLEEIKQKYYDARHHCYAYVLGVDGKKYRSNDDGEPNHSAGDPILGQIHSFELTNILIVVVRYFGGTKLGVSGLINAYKTAAQEAISNARIIVEQVRDRFRLLYSYDSTNEVMRLINEVEGQIVAQNFQEKCEVKISISVDRSSILNEKVELLKNLGKDVAIFPG